MKKRNSSGFFKFSAFVTLLMLPLSFVLLNVQAATTASTLNQAITAGTLNIAIVDTDNAVVSSPSVTFSAATFSFIDQDTTGTLGTSSQMVRLDNPTSTATWTVTIAATGGDSAVWSDGGTNTYKYNDTTKASGQLAVDPSGSTIAPWIGCANTDLSKGSADHFIVTTNPSIDLMTAGSGAAPYCRWDLTGVGMTQTIPASQSVANYTLGMTLTAI